MVTEACGKILEPTEWLFGQNRGAPYGNFASESQFIFFFVISLANPQSDSTPEVNKHNDYSCKIINFILDELVEHNYVVKFHINHIASDNISLM